MSVWTLPAQTVGVIAQFMYGLLFVGAGLLFVARVLVDNVMCHQSREADHHAALACCDLSNVYFGAALHVCIFTVGSGLVSAMALPWVLHSCRRNSRPLVARHAWSDRIDDRSPCLLFCIDYYVLACSNPDFRTFCPRAAMFSYPERP